MCEQMEKALLPESEWERIEEELIAKYGKKGLSYVLCRNSTATMCQDPKNRKRCLSPSEAPKKFLSKDICGLPSCRFSLEVRDGLVWI